MSYTPDGTRYQQMEYRRCGRSGLKLPALSLGLWQNFGQLDTLANCRQLIHTAFDLGITHFDLANNYGPPPGAAESTFGNILSTDLKAYRDELIISTKAGYTMWQGPYGDWGSRKYLVSSLDQSLRRMGLDYVDIFYHHRPDPETPLYESMSALDHLVRQGKALYVGLSNYGSEAAAEGIAILQQLGTPCIIHQPKYSLVNRWIEEDLLHLLEREGVGCITFSSLAQGLLTNKYLNGIPADSRAARPLGNGALLPDAVTEDNVAKARALNELASARGQSLAQMSLAWVLKDPRITSVVIGASKAAQITDSVQCLGNLHFSTAELERIEGILNNQ